MTKMKSIFAFCNIKKSAVFFFLVALLITFASCKKDFFTGIKSTGSNVIITRPVDGNFTTININDDVDLVLTQGDTYSIQLEGGENLLPGIETSISDSALTISNTNRYNWLRTYDKKIMAYVTLPHLIYLNYEATSTVSNKDTIREDSLFVTSQGGSGYIKLVVDIGSSHFAINHGSVDMDISGKSGVNFIFSNGYGPFNCLNLKSNYLFMRNSSSNDCYVYVTHHFEYEIMGLGNIYYRGNPLEISGTITSDGKLIKYD